MREIRIVTFIIDAVDPPSILDAIIEDGAESEGYIAEEYNIGSHVDGYWKLKKE